MIMRRSVANKGASSMDALFIGFEDQENLGLRSIISVLRANGFRTEIVPFIPGRPKEAIDRVLAYNPSLVGFSIIFQYSIEDFASLARSLRDAGSCAHRTAGGHFPSVRARELLEAFPEFDSVIRYEGELTTVELLKNINRPETWDSILGLVFRKNGNIMVNRARPLIANLDSLPSPARDQFSSLPRGIRMASMLASRGCLYNCSFCSIRQFYGGARGLLRRTRSPEAVVSEMNVLFTQHDVRFFIFQDDDFAARSAMQKRWI